MENEYNHILVEKKEHITIIRINRPEVRNALHPPIHMELDNAFDAFEDDKNAWVAIITGTGDKAFCAGADLKYAAKTELKQMAEDFKKIKYQSGGLTANYRLTKPVIAAVNGFAFGGGFEVALACDLIIAAEHATFSLPEPLVGRIPSDGGIHRLVRQIPYHLATEILYTRKRLTAEEAMQIGIVNKVVPFDQLMIEAEKMANVIMEGSPLAIRAIKQMANEGLQLPFQEANSTRFPLFNKFIGSHDFREGPRAFAEKRKPKWKGR